MAATNAWMIIKKAQGLRSGYPARPTNTALLYGTKPPCSPPEIRSTGRWPVHLGIVSE